MTVVDGEKLQIRVSKPSCGVSVLNTEEKLDFFTYRAILDTSPIKDNLDNARFWIERAYQLGVEIGRKEENLEFNKKIKNIFGIQ